MPNLPHYAKPFNSCPAYAKLLRLSPIMPIYWFFSNFFQFFQLLLNYVKPFNSHPLLLNLSAYPQLCLFNHFSPFFQLLPNYAKPFNPGPSLLFYAHLCPTSPLFLTYAKVSNICYPYAKLIHLFHAICPSFSILPYLCKTRL